MNRAIRCSHDCEKYFEHGNLSLEKEGDSTPISYINDRDKPV